MLVRGWADSSRPLALPCHFCVRLGRRRANRRRWSLHELVLGASRSIDRHEIAVLVLICGLLLFAVVTAILLLRTRARAARLEDVVARRDRRAARRSRPRQRAAAVRAAGDGGLAGRLRRAEHRGRSGGRRRLRAASRARLRQLARCRQGARRWSTRSRRCARRGEAFRMAFTTLAGRPIEAQGRAIAGRAVLRLKDASGVKRELLDLAGRHESLLSEVASLRALIEQLPSPVWTRDAAGRLTFVNAAYARAVEARDAADAVERHLELLDSAARESHRAGARAPAAPMPAGFPPSSPARGAVSTCSISAPRPAAPASASTLPKRKRCAARSPAWSMRIAARSISSRPASPCSTPISG